MDEKNKDVKRSEPLDANSSATSELAALLSVEQEINAADIQEEPVELAAETADGSISWAVVAPAMALVVAVVAWGLGAPDNFESAASAMFHWTLHPWAMYAIVGLAIAYSTYRIGRPQLISAAFTPLIGESRANGTLGKIIDSLSIFAAILALGVFVLGPTIAQLNLLPGSVGAYLSQFFEMAGRTAQSANGTAISMELAGDSIYADGSVESQLFNLLHSLPGGFALGLIAVLLLATFFITSADSASTVMASISQGGRSTPSPWLSGVWGLLTAAIGLALLVSGGDSALGNIQSVTIVAATPFLFVVVALMFALVKDLRNDVVYLDQRSQEAFQRQLVIERRHRREREEEKRLNRALRQAMGRRGPRERVRCAGTERKRK